MDELEKNKIKYHEARVKFNKLTDIRNKSKHNDELDKEIKELSIIISDLKSKISWLIKGDIKMQTFLPSYKKCGWRELDNLEYIWPK